jgi:phosphatidylinositol 4-kinase
MHSLTGELRRFGIWIHAFDHLFYLSSYPDLAEPSITHLRRFISSPIPILASDASAASTVLALAANTLANCIGVLQRKDMGLSVVYSFLNLLPSSRGDTGSSFITPHSPPNGIEHNDSPRAATHMANRSPEERLLISCSLLHTVAILAKRSKQDDITKLALSMLLQRVNSGDAALESVILVCIAELAPEAGRDMFTETVKALADFSRSTKVSEGEASSHAIFAAQTKLAVNIAKSSNYCNIQLRQLLILFVDQSLPARGVIRLGTEEMRSVLAQLLDTLSLIEGLLSLPSYRPHHDADDEMVLLFRNLWFVSVALGLTDPSNVDTELHRTALKSIATKSPCLLRGTPVNYVETELEYNPILRREHGQVSELSQALFTKLYTRD